MITTRSQSAATSCMTCEENRMQRPCDFKSRNISRKLRIAITSRPLVGSSSTRFAGSCTSARASADLDALALREALGAAVDEALHAERARKLGGARAQASLGRCRAASRNTRCSRGRSDCRKGRRRAAARRDGARAARGLAADVDPVDAGARRCRASSTPYSMRSVVDLPAPFGPSSPVISPSRGAKGDLAHRLDRAESLAERRGLDHGAGPVKPTKNGAG